MGRTSWNERLEKAGLRIPRQSLDSQYGMSQWKAPQKPTYGYKRPSKQRSSEVKNYIRFSAIKAIESAKNSRGSFGNLSLNEARGCLGVAAEEPVPVVLQKAPEVRAALVV